MTTQTRWTNAISRAIEIDGENAATYVGDGRFLIVSQHDQGAYAVDLNVVDGQPNPTCNCKAAEFGQPCWHRATALLVAGFADAPAPEPAADAAALGQFLANPQAIFDAA